MEVPAHNMNSSPQLPCQQSPTTDAHAETGSEMSTDDIEILMNKGQLWTQSDSELQTPQTTITSCSTHHSVPHIMNIQFADLFGNSPVGENAECLDPVLQPTKPGMYQRLKEKFAVTSIPESSETVNTRVASTHPNNAVTTNYVNGNDTHNANHTHTSSNNPITSKDSFSTSFQETVGTASPCLASNGSVHKSLVHVESRSEKDHHRTVREKHRKTRQRHFTDPVDFDGILRIIGGCGWWQIWVYFLISLQQVPHSMFNMSVIFMMFKPDHWCYVRDLDSSVHSHMDQSWKADEVRNISIPMGVNKKTGHVEFDTCHYYNYPGDTYHELAHMNFLNATKYIRQNNLTNAHIASCSNWTYDDSVMKRTIVTEWNLVCEENLRRADAHLAYALGYFVGCLLSGLSSDRFGRKPTVIGYGILASMFGLILPYSTYFPVFLLVRFLGAVCNEAADLAAYVLCMEITGAKYRSAIGSLLQVPWASGYCLLVLVAYATKNWRTIQIVTAALHTVTVLLICVLPESPRWLIVNSRLREAETIIRKACRMNKCTLPPDLELIKHAERRKWVKRNKRATILHLLKSRILVVRTLVIFTVWVVTALVYYGIALSLSDQSAPQKKLFSGDFFVNNAIAGAIEFPVVFICIFFLEAGRQKSQMIALTLSGMFMLGVVFTPDTLNWLRLTFMLLGKASIQAAFIILYVFTSEMYPTVVRNSAVGTASMVARTGAGIASYVAVLSELTLPYVPMIVFGVCAFFAAVLVLFLPETLHQPMPETLQDAVEFLRADPQYTCHGPQQLSQSEDKELITETKKHVRIASVKEVENCRSDDSEKLCKS